MVTVTVTVGSAPVELTVTVAVAEESACAELSSAYAGVTPSNRAVHVRSAAARARTGFLKFIF